jgi:methanogenic corrinoid protein MtbC1
LRRATEAGESIGQIADLSNSELVNLIGESELPATAGEFLSAPVSFRRADEYVADALKAVQNMDGQALELTLMEAAVQFGPTKLLDQVMQPFMQTVGDLWLEGDIRMAHEHFASAVVRSILGSMIGGGRLEQSAPRLVTTTMSGHTHELGALMAAAAGAAAGWRPIYLGADLPIEDIARTVRQSRSRVCAISIIYPPDDPEVAPQLEKLRRLIGADVKLIVGGRAAVQYDSAIRAVDGMLCHSVYDLLTALEKIRFDGTIEALPGNDNAPAASRE